jgi:hypothetical protein
LGIYTQVFFYVASTDINIIASRYDGKKTMNYLAMWEFVPITIGIVSFVWHHRFFARIGDNLHRRGINYSFGASTFWLWGVLGSLIIVGPFVCQYKFCKAMNMLAEDYNING